MTGILTGCANKPVELPDWNIQPTEILIVDPIPLPPLPALVSQGNHATLDASAVRALMAYVEAAEANEKIAGENAQAVNALSGAYQSLIEAGKMQREIARIRGELLEQERMGRELDKWFYRGVIVVGLLVVL